ncbi:hypothetical protein J7M28_14180 [bacterium]|nr:hypothetical protein [bacterium]
MKMPLEKVIECEQSDTITLARLKKLAQKTHTPLGYLFLHEPPDDLLSIPDFCIITKNVMPTPPTAG